MDSCMDGGGVRGYPYSTNLCSHHRNEWPTSGPMFSIFCWSSRLSVNTA